MGQIGQSTESLFGNYYRQDWKEGKEWTVLQRIPQSSYIKWLFCSRKINASDFYHSRDLSLIFPLNGLPQRYSYMIGGFFPIFLLPGWSRPGGGGHGRAGGRSLQFCQWTPSNLRMQWQLQPGHDWGRRKRRQSHGPVYSREVKKPLVEMSGDGVPGTWHVVSHSLTSSGRPHGTAGTS